MGRDIHIKIAKFNHESRYFEEIKLMKYNKEGELVPVDIYDFRNQEMFDAMTNYGYGEDGYGIFPCSILEFASLDPKFKEEMEKEKETFGCYGFSEISIEGFSAYLKDHMKVKDYDVEWESEKDVKYKDNPLNDLFERICYYIEFSGGWGSYKDYKVIYYFDC